jgi:CRISPR-associated protein Cmr1
MKQLEYTVRFTTPAFLGNAEQSGQWRTPPFKALLRQWWRVVWAVDHSFSNDITAMRREEGLLFGVASDGEGDSRKSRIRLRLDRWDEGRLTAWQALPTVTHPEVKFAVGSDLYLGYGPLTLPKGAKAPALKANAAIQAAESAMFSLAVPHTATLALERALALMHGFGTLGGRSRNGWGSFALMPQGDTGPLAVDLPLRPWRGCLDRDWPHAIGCDDKGPLIWQTAPHTDWSALMKTLAVVKIGLRTQFKFPNAAPPHPEPLPRHWLSYPITRHGTRAFDRNARLPNSLRFKIRAAPQQPEKFVGVIFHVPCLPPRSFNPDQTAIESVWRRVHTLLDELAKPASSRGYLSISDAQRRAALKPSLDAVSLKRIPE